MNRTKQARQPGAHMIAADRAQFVLWAPGCDTVSLELDGGETRPMHHDEDGYFVLDTPAQPGMRYRFRVSTDLAIADPVARLQAGDIHDPSILVGPDEFIWEAHGWIGRPWEETVLYELHPGLCGGFAGIEKRLSRLADIGITAIELMPIADFPGQRNWGYDGVLPYAPDTAYGTPEQLKHMVDTAHRLGLMVFLDVVYNHFGPDGNYLNTIAPDFFRDDIDTPWGSAIDFRREPVRRHFIDNALHWLIEYRFDGLRFDAVHAIKDDGFLADMAREIRAAVPVGRHIHLVLENDDNHAGLLGDGQYDAQWADDTHHCFHVLLTGESGGYYEDYADAARLLARCLAEGFAYQGEPSRHQDGKPRGTPSAGLPPSAFVAFLQNHDQIGNRAFGDRLTTLANPDALRAAVLLLLLSPQIPLIFMGEETGSTTPYLYFTDHRDPELARAVREGRRREFAKFPAFASEDARRAIPDPNDATTFTQSDPRPPDGNGAEVWHDLYRNLLATRHAHIVPGIAGAQSMGAEALGNSGVRAVWRLGNGTILTIAANFGTAALPCEPGDGDIVAAVPPAVVATGTLPARSAIAWIASP